MKTATLGRAYEPDALEHMVVVLKALGHPVRLALVALLARGEANVTELSAGLDVPQAIVSQQLRVLRMTKLVGARREEGFAVYHLVETDLLSLLDCIAHCGLRSPARAVAGGRK
jgi:DNA-binding transcriptional ArsR family regulator